MTLRQRKAIDRNEIKLYSEGRTSEILAIAGLDASYADKRNHPCLACGKNKLRISNPRTMAGGCDGCGLTWTNGADFLAVQTGITAADAFHQVAERLGIGGLATKPPFPVVKRTVAPKIEKPIELADDGFSKHGQTFDPLPWNEKLTALFCSKNGNVFSADTLVACGATLGKWKQFANSKPQNVIAIPVYSGQKLEIVNWTIFSSTGGSITYREENKQTGKWETNRIRKRAAFSGSDRVGVSLSLSTRDRLLAGERIPNCRSIKVEGQTDWLALHELLSGDASDQTTIIWTNSDGARSYFKNLGGPGWFVSMLDRLEPDYHAIIHDRDLAGVEGAKLWANILAKTILVRNVVLPMEYQEKHGKDFRDWVTAGEVTLSTLNALIDSSAIHEFDPKLNEQIQRRIESSKEAKQEVSADNKLVLSSWMADEEWRNDNRLAEKFIDKNCNSLRYVPSWNKWLTWDGRRWKVDTNQTNLLSVARRFSNNLWNEYLILSKSKIDRDELSTIRTFVKRSNESSRIFSYLSLARSDVRIVANVESLNTKNYLLNVRNGTLDLITGRLHPHDPGDMLTQLAEVEFQPGATCTRWLETLDLIFSKNHELIRFVQAILGYAITGDTGEHILPLAWGSGANGKSTVWQTILSLLGDYAGLANESLLLGNKDSHPTEKAFLYQKRFVPISEPEQSSRLKESRVKELTGDNTITARRMHEDFWSFQRTHTFWLSTNHLPKISGTDDGIWRRVKLIPFKVDLRKVTKPIPDLDVWLVANEGTGILNWLLNGYRDYRQNGFIEPKDVSDSTTKYKNEEDELSQFVEECCVEGAGCMAPANRLFDLYHRWGGKLTRTAFGKSLGERFTKDRPDSGVFRKQTLYHGIGIPAETKHDDRDNDD